MRHLSSVFLAGVAALALAGTAAFAAVKDHNLHEMTVSLPGGGVAHIQYAGNVAPRVTVRSGPFDTAWPAFADFGFVPPALAPWPVQMDRQMDVLFRRAQSLALAPWPGAQGLNEAALRHLPPGSSSYAVTTTSLGNKVCTRTVEVTTPAKGTAPQVVSRKSGDCDAQSGNTLSAVPPFAKWSPKATAIQVNLQSTPHGLSEHTRL
jgi:hypothetical protein